MNDVFTNIQRTKQRGHICTPECPQSHDRQLTRRLARRALKHELYTMLTELDIDES